MIETLAQRKRWRKGKEITTNPLWTLLQGTRDPESPLSIFFGFTDSILFMVWSTVTMFWNGIEYNKRKSLKKYVVTTLSSWHMILWKRKICLTQCFPSKFCWFPCPFYFFIFFFVSCCIQLILFFTWGQLLLFFSPCFSFVVDWDYFFLPCAPTEIYFFQS